MLHHDIIPIVRDHQKINMRVAFSYEVDLMKFCVICSCKLTARVLLILKQFLHLLWYSAMICP